MTNKGKFAHNLTVDGAGVQDKATPTLAPGSTGDLTVSLQKAHRTGDLTQRPVAHRG